MHDRRPLRSRNPTVLTRSSRSLRTEATLASAADSPATVTTRKTAAVDNGASTLCASIGTRSQFLPDIFEVSACLRQSIAIVSGRATAEGSGVLDGNRM